MFYSWKAQFSAWMSQEKELQTIIKQLYYCYKGIK